MQNDSLSPSKITFDRAFAGRFWYWRGASGEKYIHSVYKRRHCPPLPGAVYVAVRRNGDLRSALAVGRFSDFWKRAADTAENLRFEEGEADEIHVHLLARDPAEARRVAADLAAAMAARPAAAAPTPSSP
jgi:hypothetical protein